MSPSTKPVGVFRLTAGMIFAALTCQLSAATSVSQYGITWTFDANYTVGQYANGDYYVVAPSGLTITNITPASVVIASRAKEGGGTVTDSVINGSMINPLAGTGVRQGFDSHLNGTGGAYRASLNVARPGGNDLSPSNPLVTPAGSSLISTISHPRAEHRPALTDAAVLTVVAAAPASGSFRPPYCGTDKTHNWNKSNLNYGILRSLAPPTPAPSLGAQETSLMRPWIEIHTEANGRYFHPSNNQPDYGGDMAGRLGGALISLHLNYSNAQKETLYVRLVQYGLDVYGAAKNGGNWAANGGHNLGRKMPMVLAGLAFNDSNILAYANKATHNIFQEDQQTFVVDAAQLLVIPYTGDGRIRLPYTAAMLGTPEWGEKHISTKTRDGSNWGVYYRDICFRALMGHVLAAQLTTGAVSAWNWQPFFDYYDRAKAIAPASEFGTFLHSMWTSYRSLGSTAPPVAPVTTKPSNAKVSITVQ
jgi:hypothetical protein